MTQFGEPFKCPAHLVEKYKTDSRGACGELLEIITERLKKVTVNTPDYASNKQLQTVRRLFQPDNVKNLTGKQYMAYNEKFVAGFEEIQDQPQTKELLTCVDEYMAEIAAAKWLDKELRLIDRVQIKWKWMTSGYVLTHLLITLLAAPLCIPGLILMYPVMHFSTKHALKQQAKALAGSKVKVGAYDVVASEMVKWAVTYAPLFWIFYTILAAVIAEVLITESHSSAVQAMEVVVPLAIFFCMPFFCFYSIRLSDIAFFSHKKWTVVMARNSPSGRRLLLRRKEVQRKVRDFVTNQNNSTSNLHNPNV